MCPHYFQGIVLTVRLIHLTEYEVTFDSDKMFSNKHFFTIIPKRQTVMIW